MTQSTQGNSEFSRRAVGALAAGLGAAALSVPQPAGAQTAQISIEDRFAILDLFAHYAWAYDQGFAEEYAECFTPDGTMETGTGISRGRAEIREMIKIYIARRGANARQHRNDNFIFIGGGNACTVHSYWAVLEHRVTENTYHLQNMGLYVTDCVKTAEGWRIARRNSLAPQPKILPWKL